jgi:hypothetical protein
MVLWFDGAWSRFDGLQRDRGLCRGDLTAGAEVSRWCRAEALGD